VQWRAEYDPFGQVLSEMATVANSKKFTGYERDNNSSATGLDYSVFRYHSSYWGRFQTPDPFGGSYDLTDPQSFNRYAYVENDPINFTDPLGLFLPGPANDPGPTLNPYGCYDLYVDGVYMGRIGVCGGGSPVPAVDIGGDVGGGAPGPAPQQDKRSACGKFVDELVQTASRTPAELDSIYGTGINMLREGTVLHDAPRPIGGFKKLYTMGGQNHEVYAHILAHAGAILIGNQLAPHSPHPLTNDKWSFTGNQISDNALSADRNQVTDAIGSGNSDRIRAALAAFHGSIAGREVGRLMGKAIFGQLSKGKLRDELFKLLCDF